MKKVVRFFYHLIRNILFKKYRFFRLSLNETGSVRIYDRENHMSFSVNSRSYIDSCTINQIFTNNEYSFSDIGRENQVRAVYDEILATGKTPLIIDCGANIGLASLRFVRDFPQARIIAIEPNAGNVAAARANCVGYPGVEFRQAAIGAEEGFVDIEDNDVDENAFRVVRMEGAEGIAVTTIPAIMENIDNFNLFIVKIDIEGFEDDLFKSNIDWINKCPIIVCELHDWMLPHRATSRNLLKAVSSYDRDFLFKGENVFSIKNS